MDEFDVIETPENVDLQRRLAGIGSRFAAGLLDTLLFAGALVILLLVLLVSGLMVLDDGPGLVREAGVWVIALLVVLLFLVYWGYFVLFETWMNGQTPGKRYLRIRVVQQEGAAVSFPTIAIRNLLRVVDLQGFYAVAGATMFLTRRVQRLGDLAAGTVVISEEVPDYAAKSDTRTTVPGALAPVPAALEAAHLRPEEYRLLYNYWLRRDQLSLEARRQLLPKLLGPILERTGTVPAENTLAALERYLEDLLRRALVPGRDSGPEEQP